ncbi:MAG: hypothetical protein AAFR62_09350 [Cyanobacteria bacterium J06629_2]
MAQNTDSWWKSWLKLSNLIALATLVATIWGGFTFLSNRQEVDAKNNCQVRDVAQKTGEKPNLGQSVVCDGDSVIEGVKQE